MLVIVPFKPLNPKTRLSSVMSREEREEFARCMLSDVLDALKGYDVRVISTHPIDVACEVDERELNDVVNSRIGGELAVVMSDLPLLNRDVVERFFDCEGDVVIAPGRKGGTNMILIRDERFRVSYHYCSFLKHVEIAKRLGLKYTVFDSFYASLDVDTPDDLLEVLIHGKGKRSYEYLKSIGFRIEFEREPRLVRDTSPLSHRTG